MPHDLPLISVLAIGFALALLFGFLAEKLKIPTLLGYLLAGFLIGPATPGFVADPHLSNQLAEVGVMLLMFGVGIHFSLKDLLAVKHIAILGALVQMSFATILGFLVAQSWNWALGQSLVFGLSLSVASTVVLLKALETRNLLHSGNGRIAIGWLVVEDLAMVLVLVLLPPLAGLLNDTQQASSGKDILIDIGLTLFKVCLFIGLMMIAGKRLIPKALFHIAKTGSRELFTLSIIALAISLAFLAAKVFGVSFALGAFFAGMVMRESEFSHRAAEESLPLRDAFAVLFFVSVGMLFDPSVLLNAPLEILVIVGIIVLGKATAAATLVILFRYPIYSALVIAASLAQIGEFSFILMSLGMHLGLVDAHMQSLVVCGAILSIMLNPLLFSKIDSLNNHMQKHWQWARRWNAQSHETESLPQQIDDHFLNKHIIVMGYNPLNQKIVKQLEQRNYHIIITSPDRQIVADLRKQGKIALTGETTDPSTLVQAHCVQAGHLIITETENTSIHMVLQNARTLNSKIQIHTTANSQEEAFLLNNIPQIQSYAIDECLVNCICANIDHRENFPT